MTLLLHTAHFHLSQAGDGNDDHALQKLEVTVETCGAGPYLVLSSERWALDHPDELQAILARLHQATVPLFEYFEKLEPICPSPS
jgi:hypothetical protein